MVAIRSFRDEPAWMSEPEVLWERRTLAAEDARDEADAARLAEQQRFPGGDGMEADQA